MLLLSLAAFAFAQPATPHPVAGTWEGAIQIPGSPLGVLVTLGQDGEGWSGTVDIPAQGAAGIPLEAISVEEDDAVSFRMAGVPGEPTFTGVLAADSLTGTFSQGGQAFPFTLARAAAPDAAGGAADEAPPAPGEAAGEYSDPAGRFTIAAPTGWTATEQAGFVRIEGPEGGIRVDVVVSEGALLTPVEPAGAHWSTAEDMSRYLITELNAGVAPDGERVVSEENLLVTWQPQVPVSATESYGLGWIVGEYKGLPWLYHGGNTLGFTSEFTFIPGADLGIAVIANAQGANAFVGVVALKLLELVYDQPSEVAARSAFQVERMEADLAEQREQLVDRVPLTEALAYFGGYTNPALGDVSLRLADGQLLLDVGEWTTQIRPFLDRQGQPDDYVTYGAPLTGLTVRFETGDDGATSMVLGDGLVSYTFERTR